MNFCRDKQVRNYCFSLLVFLLLLFILGVAIFRNQEKIMKNSLIAHNGAVVTSLMEQGVREEVIAQAMAAATISDDAKKLLVKIGITEMTDARFIPEIRSFRKESGMPMLFCGVILGVLLLGCTYCFLWKRDLLYQQASKVMAGYMEGDYTNPMPLMEEGSIYQMLALTTQLAAMYQSRSEAERSAKEFLKNTISDISHQLKTPLAALSMYQEIITEEPDHTDTVQEYALKIGQSLKRMEQLIQSLLKIARLDVGSIQFEKNICSIPALIVQASNEFIVRAEVEKKEINFCTAGNDSLLCDTVWTAEAIGNIIKNALDHTGAGGKIHIFWEPSPLMTRIFISDNGAGISQEDIHHIFKRFYRSQNSLKTQGVGLGLSLAKSIIEGQGGMISVRSSKETGTTFILSFPVE